MFNFSRILQSGIIALILSCFLLDSTALYAQENSPGVSVAPNVSSFSSLNDNAPAFVIDENNSNLVHVLFPSLAVNGDVPNPVDLVYAQGEIVAVQSPDGTVRRELSRKMFAQPAITSTSTVADIVQAYGPIIEQVMMATLEAGAGAEDTAVSMGTHAVSRNPAAQRVRVKRVAAQQPADAPAAANVTAAPSNPPQLTPRQVGDQILNQGAQLAQKGVEKAQRGWGRYKRIGGVFRFVGRWLFFRIPIYSLATAYAAWQIWLLDKFSVGELLATNKMGTLVDLAMVAGVYGLAALATSKTARKKASDFTRRLLDKLRRTGDPNTPIEQVVAPEQQEVLKQARGKQCAANVGRAS